MPSDAIDIDVLDIELRLATMERAYIVFGEAIGQMADVVLQLVEQLTPFRGAELEGPAEQ